MNNEEAPVVMFTNYKRTDGFEVSLTLRGEDLKTVATNLDNAIGLIIKAGGTAVSRQSQKYPPKVVDYVVERVCPTDGAKLIYATKKDGSKYIKCENNKWDKDLKRATGCSYIEWDNKPGQSSEQIGNKLNQDSQDSTY